MVRFVDLGNDGRDKDASASEENSGADAFALNPWAAAATTGAEAMTEPAEAEENASTESAVAEAVESASAVVPKSGSVDEPEAEPLETTDSAGAPEAARPAPGSAWGRIVEEPARTPAAAVPTVRAEAPAVAEAPSGTEASALAETSVLAETFPVAKAPARAEAPAGAEAPATAEASVAAVTSLSAHRRRRVAAVEAESALSEAAPEVPSEPVAVVTALRPRLIAVPPVPATAEGAAPADSAAAPTRTVAAVPAAIAAFEEYPDSAYPSLAERIGIGFDAGSEDDEEEEPEPVDPERVREDLVRRLARSALSQAEVVAEGISRGLDPDQAEAAREWLEGLGYLDDAVVAEEMKHRLYDRKGKSRSVVAREMAARKIDREVIDEVLAEVADEDELAAALELALKRVGSLRSLDRATAERRLNGFLARRGYPGSVVREAVAQALGPSSPPRFR